MGAFLKTDIDFSKTRENQRVGNTKRMCHRGVIEQLLFGGKSQSFSGRLNRRVGLSIVASKLSSEY